jgi:hypothetical protein
MNEQLLNQRRTAMKRKQIVLAALLLSLAFIMAQTAPSEAALVQYDYSGNLTYHNSIAQQAFTIAPGGANTVNIWTDSYQFGDSFDPVLALWKNTGNAATTTLIVWNDDNPTIKPWPGGLTPTAGYQTMYDAGITLGSLAAGNYLLTITLAQNFPNAAVGGTLSQGYAWDLQTPIPIATYIPPYIGQPWGDNIWSAHVSYDAVPIPPSLYMLGTGLIGLVGIRRRVQNVTKQIFG